MKTQWEKIKAWPGWSMWGAWIAAALVGLLGAAWVLRPKTGSDSLTEDLLAGAPEAEGIEALEEETVEVEEARQEGLEVIEAHGEQVEAEVAVEWSDESDPYLS